MKQVKLGLVVAALMVAGAACGGNNETGNNTVNNESNATNNTPNNENNVSNATNNTNNANNAACEGVSTCDTAGGSCDGTSAVVCEADENGCLIETTTECADGDVCMAGNCVTPAPEVPKCTDDTPPARCAEDPANVTWAPASIIDDFFVEGTEDEPICCYDYGGPDDEIDNSLGQNLAGFGFLGEINTGVEESIASGSLALVLEHDGLDDLADDDDFTINFFIAQHADEAAFEANGFLADSNEVLIDPASFEMGAHPQALLPDATASGGAVSAGPGSVKIEIELFDSPLQLTISLARTDVNIDAGASALDTTGVALTNGELGGVVQIRDIFTAVNEFSAGACECLGLAGADLVNVDTGMCSMDADVQACEDAMEATCAEVAGACNLFGAVGLFADVDLDGDGLNESVSIGATYTAVGANITGVAP